MKIGSIVECINDQFAERAHRLLVQFPVKGQLYVVRDLPFDIFNRNSGQPGVLLEEIINPFRWFQMGSEKLLLEPRFYMYRFREVQPPFDLSEALNYSIDELMKIKN